MIWAESSWFVVGAALTVLVLLGLWSHQRRRRMLAEFLGGRTAMRRLSRLDLYRSGLRRTLLLALAGAALTVAAAEPRWEDAPPPPPPPLKRAIIAIDVSASMQAEDETPTRLAQAVAEADSVLTALAGHEVGLVVFAGTAYPLAPPTLDHGALRFLMAGLVPRLASAQDPGTLISAAIDESVAFLDRQPSETPGEAAPRARLGAADSAAAEGAASAPVAPRRADGGRLVVIVTDGDDGEPEADVLAAAERARAAGVELYTLGIGTSAGAGMVMPAGTYQLGGTVVDTRGAPGRSRLDETTLRRVAAEGAGAYAHVGSVADVEAVLSALAETGPAPDPVIDLTTPVWARYDLSFVLGALALALVVLESLLGVSLPRLRVLRPREAA